MKNNVSIIICAFNEEKTIEYVVSSCCKYNKESEIIVVNDGSTDNTGNILTELQKKYTFRYEILSENKGKSYAMAHGVELSTNEIILFWDADISNIKKEHFEIILKPIFDNDADMVIGQPSDTLIDYRINPFKSFSGERVLWKKDILQITDEIRHTRFGVETFINLYYQAKGKIIKYILLDDLSHPTKYQKTTPINATKELLSESKEIVITLIKNKSLIINRVNNIINDKNKEMQNNYFILQDKINNKIKELKDKINPYV